MNGFSYPIPLAVSDSVLLGHGSGGKLSAELLRNIFLPAFNNPLLARLEDQAVLEIGGARLAFTTDSFVVKPLFFRGGDIGSLARNTQRPGDGRRAAHRRESLRTEYWRAHYDLNAILQREWMRLGPKLQGKLHIYVGSDDTYFLNDAVSLMEHFLKHTGTPGHGVPYKYFCIPHEALGMVGTVMVSK